MQRRPHMLWQILPWKFIIRRAAKAYGLLDPISFLARARSFSQPSEVKEPMELLRAGMLFQARGMINARAIQFNLDWVWPYWVERQFNPKAKSFIPRGYALTHVNLTHRNWTAVGLPDMPVYPLVDARGLVTPFYDGWSLDFSVISANGRKLLPSKIETVNQKLQMKNGLAIVTSVVDNELSVTSKAEAVNRQGDPWLIIRVDAQCDADGQLAVSLRPYNPEGIQFVEKIKILPDETGWDVDGNPLNFSPKPDNIALSNYEQGDVLSLPRHETVTDIKCDIGMATAAAYFHSRPDGSTSVEIDVPLKPDLKKNFNDQLVSGSATWNDALSKTSRLKIENESISYLFESAKRTLILLSAHEIYPGPFTYRRFWFRDAVLMGNALLALNLIDRMGRHIQTFPDRQKRDGYFESQEGEWDSNGQVLWLMERWRKTANRTMDNDLLKSVFKGADWIESKRMKGTKKPLCDGLLPAGFSAEHLGPNDYYYWDDFWSAAGLQAAAVMANKSGFPDKAGDYNKMAENMKASIFRSIDAIPSHRSRGCIPASPFRRMDAGAIGSMVADYPLLITPAGDTRIMNTLAYIMENCFYDGGFFQDMVHSGINIYLTLDLAQTLLRAADKRFADLVDTVIRLASPTGNWPEAIHPFSGGGCMGDGQHGWAAAEWIMLVRNLFVREEGNTLILGSGLLPQWIGDETFFGPTATPYGEVSLTIGRDTQGATARVDAKWHKEEPRMILAIPGYRQIDPFPAGKYMFCGIFPGVNL